MTNSVLFWVNVVGTVLWFAVGILMLSRNRKIDRSDYALIWFMLMILLSEKIANIYMGRIQ
ncbi:MAG: hypothetical protein J6Y89_04970 [Lachnospiraceae bacterium]|nr:hypothetical protein [Lachnospiraceae bacterium]